jgi:hypothetical protein
VNIFKKQSEDIPYGLIMNIESAEMLKQVSSMPEFSDCAVSGGDSRNEFYDRHNDGKLKIYVFTNKQTNEEIGILKYYIEILTVTEYFVIEIAGLGDEPVEIDRIIKSIQII